MTAKKLAKILNVIAVFDEKSEIDYHDGCLWIADPSELPGFYQDELTKLGVKFAPTEGWFVPL